MARARTLQHPKDWVYDPVFDLRWLKLVSNLWFRRFPVKVILKATGEEVWILGWRRDWFGPTLRLKFSDGSIGHGYDPATIRLPRLS